MKQHRYAFRFVEFMPKVLEEGVLYLSTSYATASHICFGGCGMKVVTPLSPTDWRLTFNGDTVSLDPSIGNWSYPCRSHYILRGNRVVWMGSMSDNQIRDVRVNDAQAKTRYYEQRRRIEPSPVIGSTAIQVQPPPKPTERQHRWPGWRRILDWL